MFKFNGGTLRDDISIVVTLLTCVVAVEVAAQNDDCQTCHGDPEFVTDDEAGRERSLFVDLVKIDNSAHAGFECIMCHEDAAEIPHAEKLQTAACASCHEDAAVDHAQSAHRPGASPDTPTCASCHGTHEIRLVSDSLSWAHPKNQPQTCGTCHANAELVKRYGIHASDPLLAYSRSIHGRLLLAPNLYPDLQQKMSEAEIDQVATCSSCHTAHRVLRASDPSSAIHYKNIPTTCGHCHAEIAEEFSQSVHGVAAARGVRDAPVCTDCHGEHSIEQATAASSPTSPAKLAAETCARCHASTRIAERYGMSAQRVTTFQNSYHGLALRSGRKTVANCASCHGVHNILPSSDPRSLIHVDNLAQTCGVCHGEVDASFARGPVHMTETDGAGRIVAIVRSLYITLIVLVIGGMLVHNGLDFYRKSKQILRRRL